MNLDSFMISVDGAVTNSNGGTAVDGSFSMDATGSGSGGIIYYPTRHELYNTMQQYQQQTKQLLSLVHSNEQQTSQMMHKTQVEVDGVREKMSLELQELSRGMEGIVRITGNCVTGDHLSAAVTKTKLSIESVVANQIEIQDKLNETSTNATNNIRIVKSLEVAMHELTRLQHTNQISVKQIEEEVLEVKRENSNLMQNMSIELKSKENALEMDLKEYCSQLDVMSRQEVNALIRRFT